MTPVTPDLLHELVAYSHADGITDLAVACRVDHDGRTLLLTEPGLDFIDDTWKLPTGLVQPGETLTDALPKVLAAISLTIDEVTDYLGHCDRDNPHGETARVFYFAVTVVDPDNICRSARTGHRWLEVDELPAPLTPATPQLTPQATGRKHVPPLAGPLRACVHGLYGAEAGTELLIQHATWLRRRDFRDRFVRPSTSADNPTAAVDWTGAITALDAGHLPCSGGEERMLRLAASLADGLPVSLRETLVGIDGHNTELVTTAILHATGHRSHAGLP